MNSPYVSYTRKSPNHSGPRTHAIDRITPHCVVGQLSVESIGGIFANASRNASSNYGIGSDGRIGLFVDEWNRSWCSSSNANDQRAVTIECASDLNSPYAFNNIVYQTLITLCVDICKRNSKKKLLWINDKEKALKYEPKSDEMLLTVHRWFSNTACPGDWLMNRMNNIAFTVTKLLEDKKDGEKDMEKRYNVIKDMPEWAKPTVKKLCKAGIIKGSGSSADADGFPTNLDISYDMLRIIVWNDRAGLYGK